VGKVLPRGRGRFTFAAGSADLYVFLELHADQGAEKYRQGQQGDKPKTRKSGYDYNRHDQIQAQYEGDYGKLQDFHNQLI
jgi:hypothetical protein